MRSKNSINSNKRETGGESRPLMTMKIKILQSCLGKDGEHLEQGTIYDCDEETARALLKFHRAKALSDKQQESALKNTREEEKEEKEETGDEMQDESGDDLASYTKAQLIEIAAGYGIANAARMNKGELVQAINEKLQTA